jgi:hypothetical protein
VTGHTLQAQPNDDRAAAALVRRLDDNLQAEMRMWGRLDREFLGLLTPLQVPQLRRVHAQRCMLPDSGSVAVLFDDREKLRGPCLVLHAARQRRCCDAVR